MQSTSEGNLLEIIDLAHSLRQEHLYISNEQNTFLNLNDTLIKNSSNVAQVICVVDFCTYTKIEIVCFVEIVVVIVVNYMEENEILTFLICIKTDDENVFFLFNE